MTEYTIIKEGDDFVLKGGDYVLRTRNFASIYYQLGIVAKEKDFSLEVKDEGLMNLEATVFRSFATEKKTTSPRCPQID